MALSLQPSGPTVRSVMLKVTSPSLKLLYLCNLSHYVFSLQRSLFDWSRGCTGDEGLFSLPSTLVAALICSTHVTTSLFPCFGVTFILAMLEGNQGTLANWKQYDFILTRITQWPFWIFNLYDIIYAWYLVGHHHELLQLTKVEKMVKELKKYKDILARE